MRFVNDAFDRFERQVAGLPGEPTIGSRQNVMLAALTLSLLEILEEAGVERGYAIELTGDTCWRFYRHWGRVTKTVTNLISSDPARRLRLSVNAFLTYPFGRPGYRLDDIPEEDGRSLNMVRCSVADYLGARSSRRPGSACATARRLMSSARAASVCVNARAHPVKRPACHAR